MTTDTESLNPETHVSENLPPLPEQNSEPEKNHDTVAREGKSKRSKVTRLISVFFIFVFIVFGAAAFFIYQSGALEKQTERHSKEVSNLLSPKDIVNQQGSMGLKNSDSDPVKPIGEKSTNLSLMNGMLDVQNQSDSVAGIKHSVDVQSVYPSTSSIEEDVPKNNRDAFVLSQPNPLTMKQLETLQNSVSTLVMKVSEIEGKLGGVETMFLQQKGRTDSQAKNLADIVKKIDRLQNKINAVSYQMKKKGSSSHSVKTKDFKKPMPPTPLSFAVWDGRDSVFVEYPKGKLKMLYEGEVVDGWRVEKINANKPEIVRFKSGTNIVELGLGE